MVRGRDLVPEGKKKLETGEEKDEHQQQTQSLNWVLAFQRGAVAEAMSDGHVFQFFAFLPVSSTADD